MKAFLHKRSSLVGQRLESEAKRAAAQPSSPSISASAGWATTRDVSEVHLPNRGGGDALPHEERQFFESRFGFDFSRIRVHSDHEAAMSMNADAFTAGQHITFDSGLYRPATEAGRRLLAHELTHVIQQGHAQPLGVEASPTPMNSAPLVQRSEKGNEAGKRIHVDSTSQNLYAYDGNDLSHEFNCVTGDSDHRTTCGNFKVERKHRTYRSKKYDAQMDFAMFFHGGEAIHKSSVVGVSSYLRQIPGMQDVIGSHGCVRLSGGNAETLFDWTPMGTPVKVTGDQCNPGSTKKKAEQTKKPSTKD